MVVYVLEKWKEVCSYCFIIFNFLDCMISHGSAGWLKERLFLVSDEYRIHVCNVCGLMAIANLKKNVFECKACGNKTQISQIYLPYAFKLMLQELMAMSIAPRLITATE